MQVCKWSTLIILKLLFCKYDPLYELGCDMMKKILQFDDFNSGFRRKARLDLYSCKPKSQLMCV